MTRSRLFILEGMDSTGKSTLAKHISEKIHAKIIKSSGPKSIQCSMEAHHLLNAGMAADLTSKGVPVVLDRHWPSEWCYASTLRREECLKYPGISIMRMVNNLSPTYIYCTSDVGYETHLLSHGIAESDHCYTRQQYESVSRKYEMLFSHMGHIKYHLESDGRDIATFLGNIL